jgi:hypothetical protein
MQDREEEGCWNITIGNVFIQEPDERGGYGVIGREGAYKTD